MDLDMPILVWGNLLQQNAGKIEFYEKCIK